MLPVPATTPRPTATVGVRRSTSLPVASKRSSLHVPSSAQKVSTAQPVVAPCPKPFPAVETRPVSLASSISTTSRSSTASSLFTRAGYGSISSITTIDESEPKADATSVDVPAVATDASSRRSSGYFTPALRARTTKFQKRFGMILQDRRQSSCEQQKVDEECLLTTIPNDVEHLSAVELPKTKVLEDVATDFIPLPVGTPSPFRAKVMSATQLPKSKSAPSPRSSLLPKRAVSITRRSSLPIPSKACPQSIKGEPKAVDVEVDYMAEIERMMRKCASIADEVEWLSLESDMLFSDCAEL